VTQELFPEDLSLFHGSFYLICENLLNFSSLALPVIVQLLIKYSIVYIGAPGGEDKDLLYLKAKVKEALTACVDSDSTLHLIHLSVAINKGTLPLAPLKRVLNSHHYDRLYALETLHYICQLDPVSVLTPHILQKVKIKLNEPHPVKLKKLEILTDVFSKYQIHQDVALKEILHHTKSPCKPLQIKAIQSLGAIGQQSKGDLHRILHQLIALLLASDEDVMTESIVSLQRLIVHGSDQSHAIILFCVKVLPKVLSDRAKASIIWLVKEFISKFPTLGRETLRKLALGFVGEKDEGVKAQILNLAMKVQVRSKGDEKVEAVVGYLLKVASCDKSFQVRQKAKLFKGLIENPDLLDVFEKDSSIEDSKEVKSEEKGISFE